MMPLKAWRIVGAQKHWLHPLAFAPLLPARPPAPPPPGSTVLVRFFWVWARQSPAPGSSPGHYLPTAVHRFGPHLCGCLSAAPCPLSHGDPRPRAPPSAPSPARRPEQGDRHNFTVTQPCADGGALPSAGRHGDRAAFGSEVRGAAPGDPRPRRQPPLHLLLLPERSRSPSPPAAAAAAAASATPAPSGAPRRGSGARAANGSGMWARRQTGRGLCPRRSPGAAAGGGDGKRKRRVAPGRSRTLEELHACGGSPRSPELCGRRAAACRGEGYSEPRTVARTRWY